MLLINNFSISSYLIDVQNAMFSNAVAFNQDISSWDVSNGVDFVSIVATNIKTVAMYQSIICVANNFRLFYYLNVKSDMFFQARVFRQNLCNWDKSPTAKSDNFCTGGSYCGGDCSPTSQPSSAPSSIDLCNVVGVMGQTIFLPGSGACWRVQLGQFGTLEADFTDPSCSKDESAWQSTGEIFSYFSFVNIFDDSVDFTHDGAGQGLPSKGWSGTFQFKEDIYVTKPSLEVLSWEPPTFAVLVTIKTCSPDAICPSMKVNLGLE